MMVSARDSEGNEVTDSLSMMVKTPQVIFTAGDSEANADTDKVYYNRKSGNNDVLSFELSGLAPGVPYAVEFGYIEDETFTVSGAVYDGILSGVETGSGTYAFSTPIMNRHNNGMHPLAARLYDGMHEQPSVPFPISEVDQDGSTTDSYVNINLPLPEGYASIDLSAEDEDDLRNVNESTLTLTPVASGEATLTVIANDGNGGNASTTFNVTVDEDSNDSDTPPTADEGSNDSNSSQTGSSNESSDNNQGAGEINLTDNTAAEVQVDDAGRTVATVRLDEQSVLQAIESGADLSIAVIEVGGSVDEAKAEIPAGVISRLADNGTLIEQRKVLILWLINCEKWNKRGVSSSPTFLMACFL